MLARFASSSVTVKSNETVVKEVRVKAEMGRSPLFSLYIENFVDALPRTL